MYKGIPSVRRDQLRVVLPGYIAALLVTATVQGKVSTLSPLLVCVLSPAHYDTLL